MGISISFAPEFEPRFPLLHTDLTPPTSVEMELRTLTQRWSWFIV